MITLEKGLEIFLTDQQLKGNTEKTIHDYRQFIGYFVNYIGHDFTISDLKLHHLKEYHLSLKNKPKNLNHPNKKASLEVISPTTLQTYIRALRAFIRWLYLEGYLKENLTEKFKLPKAPKKTVEILSDDEIDTIFNAINPRTVFGIRNLCIVALMVDSGLRLNEVLILDYENIHFTQGIIKVEGKGQKERIVPLGLYTKKLLMKYVNGYRILPEYDTRRLFIDKEKKPLTEAAVKMFFTRLRRKVQIERLHPHILRHTFATKYLINGGDVFSLQQILGHTSLEMVRRYSHLASSYLLVNHKKRSLLDNIQRKVKGF